MGWLSNIFKGGSATERIVQRGSLSSRIGATVEEMNSVFKRGQTTEHVVDNVASSQAAIEGSALRRSVGFGPDIAPSPVTSAPRAGAAAPGATTTATTAEETSGGMSALFDKMLEHSGMGKSVTKGAMYGGALALGGSAFYGSTKMMAPNNSEVNNPLKNLVKGAMVGVAGGALMAASRGAGFSGAMKMAGEHAASMSKIQYGAKMVQGVASNRLVQGALAASIVAGSGDVNFTKPLNPVF
jgi:hypothetical protein